MKTNRTSWFFAAITSTALIALIFSNSLGEQAARIYLAGLFLWTVLASLVAAGHHLVGFGHSTWRETLSENVLFCVLFINVLALVGLSTAAVLFWIMGVDVSI